MKLNRLATGSRVFRTPALPVVFLLASVGFAILCLGTKAKLTGDNRTTTAPGLLSSVRKQPVDPLRIVSTGLPLVFEANYGQADSRVKFLSRGLGYGLFLTSDQAVLEMQTPGFNRHPAQQNSVIRMRLAGAHLAPQISGVEPLPGHSNYFLGNDPSTWRRNIPQFARVRYQNVYPGIDLVYYGNHGQLEYDFEVAPQADPRQIAISFDGPKSLKLTPGGDVLLETGQGNVRLQAPRIYQQRGQDQQQVPGRFVLRAPNQVAFEIEAYDRTRELVIDPVLTYATYLGGSLNEGCAFVLASATPTPGCPAIAVDSSFNIYVATTTTSTSSSFPPPVTFGSLAGTANVVISKFNASGNALLFSAYLGGNGTDYPAGIAVDSGFTVYVAGTTSSSNFPTTSSNAFQSSPRAATANHAFLTQLKADGSGLQYSTYLSGSGVDIATGLAIDNRGNAYVSGTTTSTDQPNSTTSFPATLGAFQTVSKSANQFFFCKVNTQTSGSASLVYSSYLGGSTPSTGVALGGGIAVDSNSNVYLTGGTDFTDMPVVNAAQGTSGGGKDAFVAKFNPASPSPGAQELYLTYVGGNGDDIGNAIAVDSGFNAYITGSTTSTNFSLPSGVSPFQGTPGGGGFKDAFIAKIGGSLASSSTSFPLNYFSYLGGSGDDVGLGIAVDSIQNARVTGFTNSPNFPTTTSTAPTNPPPPVQTGFGGGAEDAFVARIDTTTTSSNTGVGEWGSYLGGSGVDHGTGITVDVNGTTYVAGDTSSTDLLTHAPAQSTLFNTINGLSDIFVGKIMGTSTLTFPTSSTSPNPAISPTTASVGNQVTFKYSIMNTGPEAASNVIFSDFLPPATSATFNSATGPSSGSCLSQPVSGAEICFLGTIAVNATQTVSVILTPTATGPLANSASVTANGSNTSVPSPLPPNGTVNVTDFQISASPNSATVTAGQPASYTVNIGPLPTGATYTGQVSLNCSSGLPTQATCAFSTTPVSIPNTSPATSTLTINTTARPVITARSQDAPSRFATWLPLSAVAFLGLGLGTRRRRRLWGGFLFLAVLGLTMLQPACGSSKKTTTPPAGTPAGTYAVTVSGTSGTASHTTTVTLVVQ